MTLLFSSGMFGGVKYDGTYDNDPVLPKGFEWKDGNEAYRISYESTGRPTIYSGEYTRSIFPSMDYDDEGDISSIGLLHRLDASRDTLYVGFRVRQYAYTGTSYIFTGSMFKMFSGGQTVLELTRDGYGSDAPLSLLVGGVEVASTTDNNPLAGPAQYVYLEVLFIRTTGTVEVRAEGRAVMSASGIDMSALGSPDSIFFAASCYASDRSSGFSNRFDDVYVCDDMGDSYNEPLGPILIRHFNPIDFTADSHWLDADGNSPNSSDLDGLTKGSNDTSLIHSTIEGSKLSIKFTEDSIAHAGGYQFFINTSDQGDSTGHIVATATINDGATSMLLGSHDVVGVEHSLHAYDTSTTQASGGDWHSADFENLRIDLVLE